MSLRLEERSGAPATANTSVRLSTRYNATSNADYQAVGGELLVGIRVAVASAGTTLGQASIKVQITGGGMPEEVLITVGAIGGQLVTSGIQGSRVDTWMFPLPYLLKNGLITVNANISETSIGNTSVSVTLIIVTPPYPPALAAILPYIGGAPQPGAPHPVGAMGPSFGKYY